LIMKSKQLIYGTQDFLNELKDILNSDVRFRELGKGVYTATELIILKDLGIGVWQYTVNGEIKELRLIPKNQLKTLEGNAEIIYYIGNYDAMIRICNGEDSFVGMVINGSIDVKGDMRKLKRIQAPSERMETIMRNLCKQAIILTREQYIRFLAEHNYI